MSIRSTSIGEYAALLAWPCEATSTPVIPVLRSRARRDGRRGARPSTSTRAKARKGGSGSNPGTVAPARGPSRTSEAVMEAVARVVNLGTIRLW